jgi:hypothetical protein
VRHAYEWRPNFERAHLGIELMANAKTTQEKAEQKIARKAAAEERRKREEQEEKTRRVEQLRIAEGELARLEEAVRLARERVVRHEALSNHLLGFYDEVDKLTKGRSLLEATTLIVDQANDIIRDAKAIIDGDPYLDRIKEFVPAGTNPVYPDVLLVARSVQQCLGRAAKQLVDRDKRVTKMRREARTICAALKFFVEQNEQPSRQDVESLLGAKPPEEWFFQSTDDNYYFDLERLDRVGVDGSITGSE